MLNLNQRTGHFKFWPKIYISYFLLTEFIHERDRSLLESFRSLLEELRPPSGQKMKSESFPLQQEGSLNILKFF